LGAWGRSGDTVVACVEEGERERDLPFLLMLVYIFVFWREKRGVKGLNWAATTYGIYTGVFVLGGIFCFSYHRVASPSIFLGYGEGNGENRGQERGGF
jgi:hypothetical protein